MQGQEKLCQTHSFCCLILIYDQNLISCEYFFLGMIVSVLDPQPGERIIDCCAAPGGKTLFMASQLRGQGNIYYPVPLGTFDIEL